MSAGVLAYLPAALSLGLFGGALLLARGGRHRAAVGLIVAGGLVLRLAAAGDPYLHEWDERYHALVARNLARHPLTPTLYDDPVLPYDYRDWSANHVWVHKQPLPLWTMALSLRLLGTGEFAARLPSALLSAAAVGLTAAIAAALFGPGAGVAAALLHATNGLIIQVGAGRTATDHVDLFHLVFVELAVLLAILSARRGNRLLDAALGAAIGLAVLCKWLTALVVLPLWLVLALGQCSRRAVVARLFLISAVCAATFLPWQIHIHTAFPREAAWESAYNLKHITQPLEGHAGDWTYHFRVLPRYGMLIALPLVWFLVQAARFPREPRWTLPLLWFGIPFAFFTAVATKMVAYTLFAAPALFVMGAAGLVALWERLAPRWRTLGVAAALLLLAAPLGDLRDGFLPRRHQPTNVRRAAALKRLAQRVPDPRAVFFNAPPIETMFYTAGTAYPGLPSAGEVEELQARGYRVYVIDNRKIPAAFRESTRAAIIAP